MPATAPPWASLLLVRGVDVQLCLLAGTGILKLAGMDRSCADTGPAIQECASKLQLTVSQMCTLQLQPDLPVAADGTFCSPSRGAQQRGKCKTTVCSSCVPFIVLTEQQCSAPAFAAVPDTARHMPTHGIVMGRFGCCLAVGTGSWLDDMLGSMR
jgi:hypothetical protein